MTAYAVALSTNPASEEPARDGRSRAIRPALQEPGEEVQTVVPGSIDVGRLVPCFAKGLGVQGPYLPLLSQRETGPDGTEQHID